MNTFLKFVDLMKKGVNTPGEITIFIVSLVLALIPLFIKMIKITSLDDFDRLFVPKNERGIQQFVVQIKDYLLFSSFYIFFGINFSLLMKVTFIFKFVNSFVSSLIMLIFGLTYFIIIYKVVKTEFSNKKYQYNEKFSKIIFDINLYTGLYTFSLLFVLIPISLKSMSVLSLLPFILLTTYRSFHKRNDYKYLCRTINEKQFNKIRLVFKYTLEKDKMIFVKADDTSFKEVFMFDKTANRFFKFTKIEIL
jgi:glucan phosphoethanolaminetransferase (alkaline phosphatase superfamily)